MDSPCRLLLRTLPLHAATRLALYQCLDLGHVYSIEVAEDRVLETRSRGRELERSRVVTTREHSINEAGGERIAGSDSVHDVRDVVPPAAEHTASRREQRRPAVVVGAVTFTKRDDLLLEI